MLQPYSINYVNKMEKAEPMHWTSMLEFQGREIASTDLMIDSKAMNGKFDYKTDGSEFYDFTPIFFSWYKPKSLFI